jgi:hypothetical protein
MESALYFPAPLGDVGWGNDRLGGLRPDRAGRPSLRDWTQPDVKRFASLVPKGATFQAFHARLPSRSPSGTVLPIKLRVCSPALC